MVYFRRFYSANNFAEHDPGVIAAGSLYLAAKVEEAVVGAKQLLNAIRSMGTTWGWPCELKQLLDAEMVGVCVRAHDTDQQQCGSLCTQCLHPTAVVVPAVVQSTWRPLHHSAQK